MSEETRDTNTKRKYKVLRVTQLDTARFDDHLYQLLKSALAESLKTKPFSALFNYLPELAACLRLLLWKFSVEQYTRHFGQEILGTEFTDSTSGLRISQRQRYLYGLNFIFIKWLVDRQDIVSRLFRLIVTSPTHVTKFFSALESISNFLTLLNFAQFLRKGDHVNPVERALGLQHVYTNKPTHRFVDYNYNRRQMMWDSILQTTFCIIPYINFRKIVNLAQRYVLRYTKNDKNGKELKKNFLCGICKDVPTNPYWGPCKDIYCYFCIQSQLTSSSSSFVCVNCDTEIQNFKPVEFPMNNI